MTEVYKGWAIIVFIFESRLGALIYRPGSARAESDVLTTPNMDGQDALIEIAKGKIESLLQGIAQPL